MKSEKSQKTLNKDKLKALQETSNKAINVIRKYRKKADTPQSRAFFKEMMNNSYDIKGLETAFVEMQKQFKELFDKLSEEDKDNILEETKATYNTILQKLNQDSRYNSTDKEKMAYILALNFMFVYTVNFENGYDRYKLSKVKDNFEYELNRMLLAGSTWECTTAAISFFFALLFFVGTAMSTFPIMLSTSMFGFFVSVFYFITVSFDIIRNAIKNAFKKDEVGSDEDIIDYEELNIFQNKQSNAKENVSMEKSKILEQQKQLKESLRSVSIFLKDTLKKVSTPESKAAMKKVQMMEPTEANLAEAMKIFVDSIKDEKRKPSEEYQKQVLDASKRIFKATEKYLEVYKPEYANTSKSKEFCFVYATTFMSVTLIMNDEKKLKETEEKYLKQLKGVLSRGTVKSFFRYLIGFITGCIVLPAIGTPIALIAAVPVLIYVSIENLVFIYRLFKDVIKPNPSLHKALEPVAVESTRKYNEKGLSLEQQKVLLETLRNLYEKIINVLPETK